MSVVKRIDFKELAEIARSVRLDVLDMTVAMGGHPTSCFSCVEILTLLYLGGILKIDPSNPEWSERDRFILSKGHAAPALYSVLARAGFFALSHLSQFRVIGSPYLGMPKQNISIGIEVTSGSLGQGLSFGLGSVLASRLLHKNYRAYVLLGDGECDEGQVWQAAMAAAHFKADRLTAIVDYNKYQQTGSVEREMALEPFADKWRSFGWHVEECDGHDYSELQKKLIVAQAVTGRPQVIIAHTKKGKGVSFMENDYTFHARSPVGDQLNQAKEEIRNANR